MYSYCCATNLKIFLFCKTETLYILNNCSFFLLSPAPGNHHSSFHFYEFIYSRHIISMVSYSISFFFFNIYLFIWLHQVLFIYLFLYLFLAVLGLRFCARAFSSCGKWGPLIFAVRGPLHYRGLSCCGAQAPDAQAQ